MGKIRVQLELENPVDRGLSRTKVRRAQVDALVDTGAVMTLLPREVVRKLGLRPFGTVTVSLADDRRVELEVAGPLKLAIHGRAMNTDCLVGPPGCEALVGQLVMEAIDLILDPARRTIGPRPESPFQPTLKLKLTGPIRIRSRGVPIKDAPRGGAAYLQVRARVLASRSTTTSAVLPESTH